MRRLLLLIKQQNTVQLKAKNLNELLNGSNAAYYVIT